MGRRIDRLRGRPVIWRAHEAYAPVLAEIDRHGRRLGSASDESLRGLSAPSSTWTYIVSDDPFRDQLFGKIGGTAMGIGLVLNFPWVVLWWLYRRWSRSGPISERTPRSTGAAGRRDS